LAAEVVTRANNKKIKKEHVRTTGAQDALPDSGNHGQNVVAGASSTAAAVKKVFKIDSQAVASCIGQSLDLQYKKVSHLSLSL
jgi:hypothetical protein